MIQRVALCIVCLCFVAETTTSPSAVSQPREIHPQQTERQQVFTIHRDVSQGDFLQVDTTTPHVVLYARGAMSQATNTTGQQSVQGVQNSSLAIALSSGRFKSAQQQAQHTKAETIHSIKSKVHKLSGRSEGSVPQVQTAVSQWQSMTATWYDGTQGINGTGDGITASGARVQAGVTIAVDPKVIPLGSIVEVKFSNGTSHLYKAEDVGGAIKGNRIDIYDPSPQDCYQHGIQHVLIRIWHVKSIKDVHVAKQTSGHGGAAA